MKVTHFLFALCFAVLTAYSVSAAAYVERYPYMVPRTFQERCPCPEKCAYYASEFEKEVDNACVDFCIDKKHSLQYCTRVCSY